MENLDITFDKVLEEYDKYVLSNLIDRPYDFSQLRNKVKEFNKKYNFFDYDDNKTDAEIVRDIKTKIKSLNSN